MTKTTPTSDRRMAELAGDVKTTAATFRRLSTRWANARKGSMSARVVPNAANELYFAARAATRYALRHTAEGQQ